MDDRMKEFIANGRKIIERSTPGPWDNALDYVPEGVALVATRQPNTSLLSVDRDGMGIFDRREDAVFCAYARTALPQTLDLLDLQEAQIDTLRYTIRYLKRQNKELQDQVDAAQAENDRLRTQNIVTSSALGDGK